MKVRIGDRFKSRRGPYHIAYWLEPTGIPVPNSAGITSIAQGDVLTAGIEPKPGVRWFKLSGARSGHTLWLILYESELDVLLEPLDDYGPMGALVVDDPSGEDVCADA